MIQRLQSVLLVVVTGLLVLVMSAPLAEFNMVSGMGLKLLDQAFVKNEGMEVLMNTYPIMILTLICATISFLTIFLYKNRKLQIRLCIYNLILMVGQFGLVFYYYKSGVNEVLSKLGEEILTQRLTYISILPVISAFLTYLALKKILRDEALVRSVDRLR